MENKNTLTVEALMAYLQGDHVSYYGYDCPDLADLERGVNLFNTGQYPGDNCIADSDEWQILYKGGRVCIFYWLKGVVEELCVYADGTVGSCYTWRFDCNDGVDYTRVCVQVFEDSEHDLDYIG